MSAGGGRRFLAPEVIQTSAMDCGPAALKALLEGFGVNASYGRLREACQTSVDGTSIDTLESLAGMLGLEAEQITLPVESLLLPEAAALPALVVVTLPSGLTHFLVVWRVHGAWVQVMDPARGRRWMRASQLLREVYVHENQVAAGDFRAWAESDGFRDPLATRLRRLGVARPRELIAEALREPGWRAMAALDAAARATEALVEKAGIGRRRAAAFRALHASARAGDGLVGEDFWMARAAPGEGDDLLVRGAIALRVLGRSTEPVADVPPEVAAVVSGGEVGPAAKLVELLRADGVWRWAPLLAGLAVAAAGAVFEALLFRGFLDVGRRLQLFEQRSIAVAAMVVLVGALFCLEWPVWRGLWGIGRRLEVRLRRAFVEKIPRVGDRYFHSRPVSDMAERAHQVHWLRNLPAQAGQLVRAASELVVTTAGIIWLDPPSAPIAIALAAAMVGVPLLFQPALVERDLRMRSHAGGLARFYLDALMGLVAIRAHAGEDAMKREHAERLGEWARAAWAGSRTTVAAEAVQALAGFGLAAFLLFHYLVTATGSGWALLLVYWALALPVLGQEIGFLIAQYPHHRNVTLRLVEPLTAPEADSQPTSPSPSPSPISSDPDRGSGSGSGSTGVEIRMEAVELRAAGQHILSIDELTIAAGAHVAIVGASGGGKSSLAGLLLGWHEATGGRVLVDEAPLAGQALARLRRETVWVEPSVYLWNRSLLDNLRYGLDGGSQPVEEAIEEADLDEVLGRLPIGLQTPLGEGGALLSGGEGQRVRLGRGVLRADPRLVILDEAFRGLERSRRHALLARMRARWRERHLALHHPRHRRHPGVRSGAGGVGGTHRRGRAPHDAGRDRLALSHAAGGRPPPARAPRRRRLAPPGGRRRQREREGAAGVSAAMDLPVWPTARLGEALAAVARQRRGRRVGPVPEPPAELGRGPGGGAEIARWIGAAARSLGLAGAPVDVRSSAVGSLVAGGGPMVLALPEQQFLVLLGTRRRDGTVGVLGPDEAARWLPEDVVSRRIASAGEGGASAARDRVDGFCDELGLSAAARAPVAAVLGRARATFRPVQGWTLEPSEPRFWPRVGEVGGLGLAARGLIGFILSLLLALAAWWVVGRGALDGRLEPGWLWAWALILASMVACQAVASWAVGKLAVHLGGLTKERVLEGILALAPEDIRSRGVGQLMGSVLETEALEALARAGGPLAVAGLLQILVGGVVLGLGAAPWLHLTILVAWLAMVAVLGARYHRRLLDWAEARLSLTHDLVESMVGHRTLVAQRPPGARSHDDDAIAVYERRAAALDGAAARLTTLAPRGWLAMGLLGLAPGFVSGRASPDGLAVSLGGILLIYWAMRKLVDAGPALAAAALAWKRTRSFFRAAAAARPEGPPVVVTATDDAAAGGRGLLVARDVTFRYPSRAEPALRGCSFVIRRGDRVLLQGRSGSGKSTLGSILTGLREPSSGVLLLGGFDHHSLGPARWRERSGAVPQFHENHVLSASLVFNLALGRGWPPRPEDWREVEAVCAELGLGDVLARMPAGLQQMVGDSGWQLSHGERSRLFVARSLLQDLDVRVLDESFAALDPETFERVLACVLKRTRTLVVVAHT